MKNSGTSDFEAFAGSLLDPIVLASSDGNITYVNSVAEAVFGYSEGEMAGQNLLALMPERYREAHLRGMNRFAQNPTGRPLVGRTVELHAIKKDGSEFPIELSLSSWNVEGATTFSAVIRDLSERRREERNTNAQTAITRLIADSRTLAEAAARVIETICRSMEWEMGAMWILDPRLDRLCCSQFWDSHPLRQSKFEKDTLRLRLAIGEGLPGRVWSDGTPQWFTDELKKPEFLRWSAADELNLNSAFAFPIFDGGGTNIGVLEFFTQEKRPPDPRLLQMMEGIGRQIGALLERSHAVEAVLTIVEQMQVGVLAYRLEDLSDDRSLRLISMNPAAAAILNIPADQILGQMLDTIFPNLREHGIPQLYFDVVKSQKSIELEDVVYGDQRVSKAAFSVKAFPLPNHCVGIAFENITKRKSVEQLMKAERSVLERVAEGGSSYVALLSVITRFVNEQTPEMLCSIQLLGSDGTLSCIASEGLADEFARSLCSNLTDRHNPSTLAVFERDMILISSIAIDDRAASIRSSAAAEGLRSCWATPIITRSREVVGTISLFYSVERAPTVQELEVTEFASRLAAIIIERHQAEEGIRSSEARFRALIKNSEDAIHLHDAARNIVFRSPASERILGYPDSEMLGLPSHHFIHEGDLERVARQFETATLEGTPMTAMFRARHRDGRWIWLDARISNLLDDVNVGAIVVNFRDVTERHQAEQTLRESEERFNSFTNNAPLVAFIKDDESRYIWVNEEFEELFAMPLETVVGKTDLELFDRTTAEVNIANDASVLQLGDSTTSAGTMRTADGVERSWIFIKFPLTLSSGERQIGGVAIDVTERDLLEKQLERSERISSLGRLAANIAHEINNVLMGILPFAELVRKLSTNEKQLNAAQHIVNSVERGRRITQDILSFTRASQPVMRPFNCRNWIEEMAPEIRSLLGEVELDIEFPSPEISLRGDPRLLHQVMTNLAINARDATNGRGRLTVRMSRCEPPSALPFPIVPNPEGFLHLTVADTGSGIPPEIIDRIFEPMFTTKANGTGLGLAITHQVIATHGGEMHVESTIGTGTTFHLMLPCANNVATGIVSEGAASVTLVDRILLVEDDEAVGAGIQTLLEYDGVNVLWVKTGGEAAAAIETFNPDILLLDVGLPDINGFDLYRKLSIAHPLLPTIFSSGHAEQTMIDEFVGLPVARLLKPYDHETLLGTVAAMMRNSEMKKKVE